MQRQLKVVTIVGARPQFIKAAVISRDIRQNHKDQIQETIVHTGQHYDHNMSQVFFDEMNIPNPDVNLNVGSGTHGWMTGTMLHRIEDILLNAKPDVVLVYGDTNSTLAGSLAAVKLHIPLAHVEAGLRSFNRSMPEEINRVLTDHAASFLYCPTDAAVTNLNREGITEGVVLTGDVMFDAMRHYLVLATATPSAEWLTLRDSLPDQYYLLTLHRAENTDDPHTLTSIVSALHAYGGLPGVLPIHPRTRKMLAEFQISLPPELRVIEAVGYQAMIQLEATAKFIVTDSGGVQKEAYFNRRPCITLRAETEWVETVEAGANTLVGSDTSRILNAMNNPPSPPTWAPLYGDGRAGQQILEHLIRAVRIDGTRSAD